MTDLDSRAELRAWATAATPSPASSSLTTDTARGGSEPPIRQSAPSSTGASPRLIGVVMLIAFVLAFAWQYHQRRLAGAQWVPATAVAQPNPNARTGPMAAPPSRAMPPAKAVPAPLASMRPVSAALPPADPGEQPKPSVVQGEPSPVRVKIWAHGSAHWREEDPPTDEATGVARSAPTEISARVENDSSQSLSFEASVTRGGGQTSAPVSVSIPAHRAVVLGRNEGLELRSGDQLRLANPIYADLVVQVP